MTFALPAVSDQLSQETDVIVLLHPSSAAVNRIYRSIWGLPSSKRGRSVSGVEAAKSEADSAKHAPGNGRTKQIVASSSARAEGKETGSDPLTPRTRKHHLSHALGTRAIAVSHYLYFWSLNIDF